MKDNAERSQGDLINREALKKEVERFKDTGYDTNNEPLFDFVELSTLFKIIDNAPTVGVRPQGEWLKFGVVGLKACYKCSICGRYVVDNIENNVTETCPFCHCGADMRGGVK